MKAHVDGIRRAAGHRASSHAFASLFLWQKDMGLSILLREDAFAVRCRWRGDNAWFFPCGREEAVSRLLEELLGTGPLTLCYMRQEDAALLNRRFPGRFSVLERPEDHEYLYDREGQESLAGGRFVRLRNDLHAAHRGRTLTWKSIGPGDFPLLWDIYTAWNREGGHGPALTDGGAVRLLVDNWQALDATGVLAFVDGVPLAAAAGYPIGEDVFDISFCKAKNRLRGLPVYTRQALIGSLDRCFTLINAEEDLGSEGLRLMKSIMRPIEMLKMYEGRS